MGACMAWVFRVEVRGGAAGCAWWVCVQLAAALVNSGFAQSYQTCAWHRLKGRKPTSLAFSRLSVASVNLSRLQMATWQSAMQQLLWQMLPHIIEHSIGPMRASQKQVELQLNGSGVIQTYTCEKVPLSSKSVACHQRHTCKSDTAAAQRKDGQSLACQLPHAIFVNGLRKHAKEVKKTVFSRQWQTTDSKPYTGRMPLSSIFAVLKNMF